MIITIDIDGVVAAMGPCDFNKDLRNYLNYNAKLAHPTLDRFILNKLITRHVVYFVSARSYKGAAKYTRQWLDFQSINVEDCQGVICTEGLKGEQAGSNFKPSIVKALGSDLHIDDHAGIIPYIEPSKACLFYNDSYTANTTMFEGDRPFYRARDWKDIEAIVKATSDILSSRL